MATELPPETRGLYAHFLHTPSSVARYAAVLRGLPWSFSAHAKDIWTSPEWELSEKLHPTSFGADFGVTCTNYGAQHLQSLADRPERVRLVYHGLDLGRFPAPPERPLRDTSQPMRILSVGRLVEKKGFDRLLDAFALLPSDLRFHWTHIGGGTLSDDLQAKAQALGLSPHITWRGACDQPEVIAAMRAADLFALPSRIAEDGDRDGLPNVLMEAASQKLPILTTPVSAIPEFIENGGQGWLSNDDPAQLAKALHHAHQSPDQAATMAEAAYMRLRTDFGMDRGIKTLDRLLRDMLA